MQVSSYDRLCITVVLTCAALGSSYWVAAHLFGIPVGHVLPIMLSAIAVSAGLRRPVTFLQKWLRVPRSASILLMYLGFFALVTWASVRAVPLVSEQVYAIASEARNHWISPTDLAASLPTWASEQLPPWLVERMAAFAQDQTGALAGHLSTLVGSMSGIVGGLLTASMDTLLLFMFVFFLTRTEGIVSAYLTAPINDADKRQTAKKLIDQMMLDLGQWANAQIIIGAFFGSSFGTALSLAGVPYGFTIGLIGFLGEALLPMVGSIFTLFVLAIPVALVHGGPWGLATVLIIYAVIFFLEWHVVYLFVMGRALKFDALLTLFFMWIGYFPLGIIGSVLVLPIMVIGSNLMKFTCPHLADKGDPGAAAHVQLLQTLLRRAHSGEPGGETTLAKLRVQFHQRVVRMLKR